MEQNTEGQTSPTSELGKRLDEISIELEDPGRKLLATLAQESFSAATISLERDMSRSPGTKNLQLYGHQVCKDVDGVLPELQRYIKLFHVMANKNDYD